MKQGGQISFAPADPWGTEAQVQQVSFEPRPELSGLGSAGPVAVPLVCDLGLAWPQSSGIKRDCTILICYRLSGHQDGPYNPADVSQAERGGPFPARGGGGGRGWPHGAESQHHTAVPPHAPFTPATGSTQLGHTHWTPTKTCDKLGTDQVSRAICACLRPFWFRPGLDLRTTGRRQCSPFWSLLVLKEGSQDGSGRVGHSTYHTATAPVSLLKGSIKCNRGEWTPCPHTHSAPLPLVHEITIVWGARTGGTPQCH